MNMSMPQENRLAVFHSPRLISAIVQIINQDEDESRKGCCAVLAHLAKTQENRLLMAQVPGLLDAITGVIEPMTLSHKDCDERPHMDQEEQPLYSVSTSDASAGAPGIESFCSGEEKVDIDEKPSLTVPSAPSEDPSTASRRYDDNPNANLHGARTNVFALLSHLVKEKDNAVSEN
jgi:hypothetical protein